MATRKNQKTGRTGRTGRAGGRMTVPEFMQRKRRGSADEPLVCLTAYHARMAEILDKHVDMLLVGDSLGMVVYGMADTLAVSLDMMIAHSAAVMRGSKTALVVVDMPFGSYQTTPENAFANAARMLRESGCQAVKIEGGRPMAATIRYLHERGIPVMAHIGLTPQSVHAMGGYKIQGGTQKQWAEIEADAQAVVEAGAFCVVLEGMVAALAERITQQIPVPTIGIGASPACDGQVLVLDDILGLSAERPRFVRQFAELDKQIDAAARAYAEAVRKGTFPAKENIYGKKPPIK